MTYFYKKSIFDKLNDKLNNIENKIDIKNDNLFKKLKDYLEVKFNTINDLSINEINLLRDKLIGVNDEKKEAIEYLIENIINEMKNNIVSCSCLCKYEDIKNVMKELIQSEFKKHTSQQSTLLANAPSVKGIQNENANEIIKLIKKLDNVVTTNLKLGFEIINKQIDLNTDEYNKKLQLFDNKLRENIHDILISIKNDIIESIHKNTHTVDDEINNLTNIINTLDEKISGLYNENESFKHQLLLEHDIRSYYDEINGMKLLLENLKKSIDEMLYNNNFSELQHKYQYQ